MKKLVVDCSQAESQIVDMTAEEIAAAEAVYNAGLSERLKTAAKQALLKSDDTAIRCVKAGVTFPQDWQDYVTTLREIVRTGAGEIPKQPDYPEGT